MVSSFGLGRTGGEEALVLADQKGVQRLKFALGVVVLRVEGQRLLEQLPALAKLVVGRFIIIRFFTIIFLVLP